MRFIANILISALAVVLVSYLLPGVHVADFTTALLVALVLAFLNSIIKPILTILTIPITLYTMGLFLLVINALIIIMTDRIVDGFSVNGFWWALLFSLILSITTGMLNIFFGNRDDRGFDQMD